MSGSGRDSTRRGRTVAGVGLMVALLLMTQSCFEPAFEPNSPLDSRSDYSATLQDVPDTVFARMSVFQARFVFDPPTIDGLRVQWSTSDPALFSIGDGRYRSEGATAVPRTIRIGAELGKYSLEADVVMMARVDTIDVGCFDTGCETYSSFGDTRRIFVRAVDSGGRVVQLFDHAIQTRGGIVARDTTVVRRGTFDGTNNYWIEARGNGTTWLVVSADRGRDSILVTVGQVAVTWDLVCPTSVRVGETARLEAVNPRDARGNLLTIPGPVVEWTPGFETSVPSIGASATIAPSGSITANATGGWRTQAVVPSQGYRVIGQCDLYLDP